MPAVSYYHRYRDVIEEEAIFGEKWLRYAYENPVGRVALHLFIKRAWFSRAYGKWADTEKSAEKIADFIREFELDESEFLLPTHSFKSFNDFFARELKSEARPISAQGRSVSFPADGRHLYVPDLDAESWVFAKGRKIQIGELLGYDPELTEIANGGCAVLSRLCPTDYHRFHFPLDGVPGSPLLINGPLYSVNPIALSRDLRILWENKRQITRVKQSPVGDYLFLEIGATNVGSMIQSYKAGSRVERGEEKGYFRFGGSMTITIFPAGVFEAAEDLKSYSLQGLETFAHMGDVMGQVTD